MKKKFYLICCVAGSRAWRTSSWETGGRRRSSGRRTRRRSSGPRGSRGCRLFRSSYLLKRIKRSFISCPGNSFFFPILWVPAPVRGSSHHTLRVRVCHFHLTRILIQMVRATSVFSIDVWSFLLNSIVNSVPMVKKVPVGYGVEFFNFDVKTGITSIFSSILSFSCSTSLVLLCFYVHSAGLKIWACFDFWVGCIRRSRGPKTCTFCSNLISVSKSSEHQNNIK